MRFLFSLIIRVIYDSMYSLDLYRFDAATMRIVAGEHSLSVVSGLEQNRDVVRYLMHENYDVVTSENDIALIFV